MGQITLSRGFDKSKKTFPDGYASNLQGIEFTSMYDALLGVIEDMDCEQMAKGQYRSEHIGLANNLAGKSASLGSGAPKMKPDLQY